MTDRMGHPVADAAPEKKKVTTALLWRTYLRLRDRAEMTGQSLSAVLGAVADKYAAFDEIREEPLSPDGNCHVAFIARTGAGKTTVTREGLVPMLEKEGWRILAIDPDHEYTERDGFEQIPLESEEIVLPSHNEAFEAMQLVAVGKDSKAAVASVMNRIVESKSRRMAVALNAADYDAEVMLVSTLLKQLVKVKRPWSPPLAVIVEEAPDYDCRQLVRRGRKKRLKGVLLSQYPLDPKTMTNVNVILGSVDPEFADSITRWNPVGAALDRLKPGEFLRRSVGGHWTIVRHKLKRAKKR